LKEIVLCQTNGVSFIGQMKKIKKEQSIINKEGLKEPDAR
jgi:hypothetical protein